jgi:DNA-binding transcriptional MerR regulator
LIRFRSRGSRRAEWLALGEASRFLGVTPGTLRRWSDAGRVSVFTTPGGHRRYRRTALEGLLPADRAARGHRQNVGLTITRVARAYREEARSAARLMPWLVGLTDSQREWFRVHGRQLAERLLEHLDSATEDQSVESLRQASEDAAGYGRMAADLGLSLSQAVEGFLQFRRPFLHQLAASATSRGLDVSATTELMERTERAMDRLLMSAMAGHGVQRATTAYAPAPTNARLPQPPEDRT